VYSLGTNAMIRKLFWGEGGVHVISVPFQECFFISREQFLISVGKFWIRQLLTCPLHRVYRSGLDFSGARDPCIRCKFHLYDPHPRPKQGCWCRTVSLRCKTFHTRGVSSFPGLGIFQHAWIYCAPIFPPKLCQKYWSLRAAR
jgi:hypothetical protein